MLNVLLYNNLNNNEAARTWGQLVELRVIFYLTIFLSSSRTALI